MGKMNKVPMFNGGKHIVEMKSHQIACSQGLVDHPCAQNANALFTQLLDDTTATRAQNEILINVLMYLSKHINILTDHQ